MKKLQSGYGFYVAIDPHLSLRIHRVLASDPKTLPEDFIRGSLRISVRSAEEDKDWLKAVIEEAKQ